MTILHFVESEISSGTVVETTPTFVCELPLRIPPRVRRVLDIRLNAARWTYNACVGEAAKRVALVRERKLYRRALGLPRGPERVELFRMARVSVGFTDAALHKLSLDVGSEQVGIDVGTSTLAAFGSGGAMFEHFCAGVTRDLAQVRRLRRHADRQRRASNPENFLADGRIRPGPKNWAASTRQRKVLRRLADIWRRERIRRRSLHGQLGNRLLALGTIILTERLSYQAFKQHFGASVNMRAPGLFVALLRRKVERVGGRLIEFDASRNRLSQVCHCGMIRKKRLSQRTHACPCGVVMQRDLYSAFLAWCVDEKGLLNVDQARECWSGAKPLLQATWSKFGQPANRRFLPSSFEQNARSQSGLPAKERIAESDARDAVALQFRSSESPGEVEVVPLRIPGDLAGRERLRDEHMFAMIAQVKCPRPLKQSRPRGVLE